VGKDFCVVDMSLKSLLQEMSNLKNGSDKGFARGHAEDTFR
jgi:hypothetical protein